MADNDKNLKGGSGLGDFANDGTMDIVAYIVAGLGLLFSFFNPTVGGVLIGVVTGIYFSSEIMCYLKGFEGLYKSLGMSRAIVAGAALLALVISIPTFFVTAAIVGAVTSLVKPKASSASTNEPSSDDSSVDEE